MDKTEKDIGCPTCQGSGTLRLELRTPSERYARAAYELSTSGHSFRAIAKALGLSGPSHVKHYVDQYRESLNKQEGE